MAVGQHPLVAVASALVLRASLVSGCVGGDVRAADAAPVRPADPPKPAVDTGSLAGVVTDDERVPISRAQVAVVEQNQQITTDEAGAFTFNGLPAGSFGLVVQALGFEEAVRKVEVRVGEVTFANFTLRALLIEEEFTETVHVGNLIQLSHAFINYYVPREIEPCGECTHYREVRKGSKEAMAETIYTNGVPQPMDDLWYNMNKNWTNATGSMATRGGQHVKSGYIKSGAKSAFTEAEMGNFKGVTKLLIYLAGGYTSVSVNKRVDFWLSMSYGGEFPENFTALPPK